MTHRKIKDWPEEERPRERLLAHGPGSLSDGQLPAIILRTGGHDKSAMDMAIGLLKTFGGLKEIEEATLSEICKVRGMGTAKAAQLKAGLEQGKRLMKDPRSRRPSFSSGGEVFSHFHPLFRNLRKEVFYCLLLDVKNRADTGTQSVRRNAHLGPDTPREAFREAIRECAAAAIFVHNHPSGDPGPSREDIAITEKLESAREAVGIRVLGHVIAGDGEYASRLEKGYLRGR
jgi:DNA repair protein RadC